MTRQKPIINPNIESKYGFMVIRGRYFQEITRDGKTLYEEIPKKLIKEYEKKAVKIAEELKESLDTKKVLKESIMKMTKHEIDKLYEIVFKTKRKHKIVTREHHCVDMKIGNFILPIVE